MAVHAPRAPVPPVPWPSLTVILGLCVLGSWMLIPATLAAAPRVLVVHSWHLGFGWTDQQHRGMQEALDHGFPEEPVDLVTFFLDAQRAPEGLEAMVEDLERHRGRERFDLVWVTDDPAYAALRDASWRREAGIPLVFSGVNNLDPRDLAADPTITGVVQRFTQGRAHTLDLMLRFFPRSRRIVLLLDHTEASREIRNEIETLAPLYPALSFSFLIDEDLEGQERLAASLTEGEVLFPVGIHRDRDGSLLSFAQGTRRLAKASSVPLFGFIPERLGQGIVGGALLDGVDHGRRAGEMVAAILKGASPADLSPVLEVPDRLVVDAAVLARFMVPVHLAPASTEFINREASLYDILTLYFPWILGYVILSLALSLTLFLNGMRLRQARNRLRHSEAVLRTYLDYSPQPIFVGDAQGNYLFANRQACRTMGVSLDQILTMKVFDHWDPSWSDLGRGAYHQVLAQGSWEGEMRFRRNDGSFFPMYISASLLDNGNAIAIGRDLSLQKAQEARINQTLAEKETLLQELYHRTKNNMALINALLALYAEAVDNDLTRGLLTDLETRIHAMALVHEMLYEAQDLWEVDLGTYLRDLAAWIGRRAIDARPSLVVDQNLRIEAGLASLDHAVPLGLVLTEVLLDLWGRGFATGFGQLDLSFSLQDQDFCLRASASDYLLHPDEALRRVSIEYLDLILRHQFQGQLHSPDPERWYWEARGTLPHKTNRLGGLT